MTEDEAQTVAALAAQYVWGRRSRWDLIMRYGRLFTPGTDAGGGPYPKGPLYAGRKLIHAAGRWKCQMTSDGQPPAARAADGR